MSYVGVRGLACRGKKEGGPLGKSQIRKTRDKGIKERGYNKIHYYLLTKR